MPTIALRVPTIQPDQPNLPGGHCYLIFTSQTISVRDLIAEKVRAELRKARAGGPQSSTLHLLISNGDELGHDPLSEVLAVEQALAAFEMGHYLLLVDGRPMTRFSEVITLTRRTAIVFLIPTAEAVTA